MSQDKEREAFEAQIGRELGISNVVGRDEDGVYLHVEQEWRIWQAAWSAALASQQAVKGEPVMCQFCKGTGANLKHWNAKAMPCEFCQGKGASPPSREPLTDEQIREWWRSENGLEDMDLCDGDDFRTVVRAVEARLGIHSRGEGEKA